MAGAAGFAASFVQAAFAGVDKGVGGGEDADRAAAGFAATNPLAALAPDTEAGASTTRREAPEPAAQAAAAPHRAAAQSASSTGSSAFAEALLSMSGDEAEPATGRELSPAEVLAGSDAQTESPEDGEDWITQAFSKK